MLTSSVTRSTTRSSCSTGSARRGGELQGARSRTIVNTAVLQTIPRTINTGLGTLFILGALLFLGGESLSDFALALLIGIIVGTYSSMFVAAPALDRARGAQLDRAAGAEGQALGHRASGPTAARSSDRTSGPDSSSGGCPEPRERPAGSRPGARAFAGCCWGSRAVVIERCCDQGPSGSWRRIRRSWRPRRAGACPRTARCPRARASRSTVSSARRRCATPALKVTPSGPGQRVRSRSRTATAATLAVVGRQEQGELVAAEPGDGVDVAHAHEMSEPNSRSTSSPALWPCVSLTALKSSRSSTMTEPPTGSRCEVVVERAAVADAGERVGGRRLVEPSRPRAAVRAPGPPGW